MKPGLPTRLPTLKLLLLLLFAGYCAYVALAYRDGFARAARGERPLFTDFTTTYAAALLARHEPVEMLYHPERIRAANRAAGNAAYGGTLAAAQTADIIGPWMYPPPTIFFVLPLAGLSYHLALLAMLATTAALYLAATGAWLRQGGLGLLLGLAAPPTFYNLMFGQTSFLPAGLLGLGLFLLRRRPWLAGILIGLASVKPHLGVLLPLALLAGGHWKSFCAAAATVLGLIAASLLAFGSEPWFAFIGTTLLYLDGFAHNAYAWRFMPSMLSLAHWAGATLDGAQAVQWLASAACAVLVAGAWWLGRARPASHAAQCALLLAAAPLVVPMVFYYDLVVLVVAAACLLHDMQLHPARRWEMPLVVALLGLLLLIKPAGALGVPLAVGVNLALLSLGVLRFSGSLKSVVVSTVPAGDGHAASPSDAGRTPDSIR